MRTLLILLQIQIASLSFAQVQFTGFDRAICGHTINNTYTYTNYTLGSGSGALHGYKVYKNGVQVFDDNGSMSNSKTCKDLIFINDSVGFLVYYGSSANRLTKTQDYGQSWIEIGNIKSRCH